MDSTSANCLPSGDQLGAPLIPLNPDTLLRFAVAKLRRSLQDLAIETDNRTDRELERVLGKMHHDLEYARASEIVAGDMSAYFDRFREDLKRVHRIVYSLYISWEIQF